MKYVSRLPRVEKRHMEVERISLPVIRRVEVRFLTGEEQEDDMVSEMLSTEEQPPKDLMDWRRRYAEAGQIDRWERFLRNNGSPRANIIHDVDTCPMCRLLG